MYGWNTQQDLDLADLGVCGLSLNAGLDDALEVGVPDVPGLFIGIEQLFPVF